MELKKILPRIILSFCLLLLIVLSAPKISYGKSYKIAVLQALDKVTARVFTLRATSGQILYFGTLEVVARHCEKRPPEDPPESAAFLEITEVRPGGPKIPIFFGWMFASSPALSALEHPVYDIWVLDCVNDETKGTGNKEE